MNPSRVATLAVAMTLSACGKGAPPLPEGARVVVTLQAAIEAANGADPAALREALKDAWSDRFRAARDNGSLPLESVEVDTTTTADPGTMALAIGLRLATDTCTETQASELADRLRSLTTTNVDIGFYKARPEDAEALATKLREGADVTDVRTPTSYPGAIEVTPSEGSLVHARKLAPPTIKVIVEHTDTLDERGRTTRERLWVVSPSPALDGRIVVGASIEDAANNQPTVVMRLSEEGARAFGDLSGSMIGQPLLIVVDDLVVSAPKIMSRISGTKIPVVMATPGPGRRAEKDAEALVAKIRYGRLPTVPTIAKLVARCAP